MSNYPAGAANDSRARTMIICRRCKTEFKPTDKQLSRREYACDPCQKMYYKEYRIRRKKEGKPLSREAKFYAKVIIVNGCWIYPAYSGIYPQVEFNKKRIAAHRQSYIYKNGPIPEGLLVCHKCDNTKCVNPDHLFLGTHKDNTQDMIRKGRSRLRNNVTPKSANLKNKTANQNNKNNEQFSARRPI